MRKVLGFGWPVFLYLVLTCTACGPNKNKVVTGPKLSPFADSVLTQIERSGNLVTDSLLRAYHKLNDIHNRLLKLNQLLENRKVLSPKMSRELISLGKKYHDRYNELYATLNYAGYCAASYQFDSSNTVLNHALAQTRLAGYDSLTALAFFYRAGNRYMIDEYDLALTDLDSCMTYAQRAHDNTRMLQAQALMGAVYSFKAEFDRSIGLLNQVRKKSLNPLYMAIQGNVCFMLGQSHLVTDNRDSAIFYLQRCDSIGQKLHDKGLRIKTKSAMVTLKIMNGDYVNALKNANEGIKLSQEIKDKSTEAFFMNSAGDIYKQRYENEDALKSYRKALKLAEELKDDYRRSLLLIDISALLSQSALKKTDSSLYYARQGLLISEKTGDQLRISDALAQIGSTYFEVNQYDSAEVYYNKAIGIARKIGYQNKVVYALNFLAEIAINKRQYARAKTFHQEISRLISTGNVALNLQNYYRNSYRLNKVLGDYKLALNHFEKFKALTDSTNNATRSREISKIEYDFKTSQLKAEQEKKDLAYKARQQEKEEEIRRSALIRNFLLIGLLLLLLLLFFIFRSLVANRRAKKIIEQQKKDAELSRDSIEAQKKIIEEKNTEIVQSITYAEGIQRAILANEHEIKKYFPESFLLFRPKDIVAGDFYFFEKTDTHIFYAAADCTGHGVPGALVSMVCSNALRRCVNEYKLTDPGKILDQARLLVIETFEKSGKNVKDGMDISLISVPLNQNSAFNIQWSGAHNPLWFTQNGKMVEITANKQPVGFSEKPVAFVTHQVTLQKGEMFYLFTDGYADQFGGERGKKLKNKNFQELLLQNHRLPAKEQARQLEAYFITWKDDLEQVDDVCVMGVRV